MQVNWIWVLLSFLKQFLPRLINCHLVIFKKGIQWDQPWLSSNDFQRGDALRELENYFLSTELEVNFLSLEDMQEHLAQKRGMKRVITMQEVITLTPNLSELYLS